MLDVGEYSDNLTFDRKKLESLTSVPGVKKMTRVLFKDLKKLTDVTSASLENLTKVENVKDIIKCKWVKW